MQLYLLPALGACAGVTLNADLILAPVAEKGQCLEPRQFLGAGFLALAFEGLTGKDLLSWFLTLTYRYRLVARPDFKLCKNGL